MSAKVIFAYEQLPAWLKIPAVQKNKLSLKLQNGSQIIAKSSSPDAARGIAASLLLVDECLTGSQEVTVDMQGTVQDMSFEQLFSLGEPVS